MLYKKWDDLLLESVVEDTVKPFRSGGFKFLFGVCVCFVFVLFGEILNYGFNFFNSHRTIQALSFL